MNRRSFFAAFGVIGFVLGVAGVLLVITYQAGVFEGYNGETGIDWDNFWGTFGGLQSFVFLVGGLILAIIFGSIAAALAHHRQRVLAFIFVLLALVAGALMGAFTQWGDIDWLGVWNLIWPFLVWLVVSAATTFFAILAYERFRA